MEEFIRAFDNTILGTVEQLPNGDQIARLFSGKKIVGYYRKNIDCTTDFYGKIVSKGNTLVAFIIIQNQRIAKLYS